MIGLFAYLAAAAVMATSALAQSAGTVTPAGVEWSEIGSGLPRTMAGVKLLVIDSASPSTLYAVDSGGRLFKSTNSGGSWKLRGNIAGVGFIVVDPTNSANIYAVTQRGVFKSVDGGENWAAADSGLAGNTSFPFPTIAVDPLTPDTLYAVTTRGIFKSMDAARSWSKLDTLPAEAYGKYAFEGGVTIDPVSPSTIYVEFVAANDQGVLKSTDGGQSWNKLNNAPAIILNSLVVDPVTSSNLYARSTKFDGNIFKSTDGGQTWTVHAAAPPGTGVASLAIDPLSPSTVYAVYWASPSLRVWGIVKSMDSGENWSVVDPGLPAYANDPGFPQVYAFPVLAVSPTTPATVYSGYFQSHPSFQPDGHLAKSTDGGVTWSAADAGLAYVDARTVTIDPVIPSRVYAGLGGAGSGIPLFKSADGGANWSRFTQFQFISAWYGWISSILVGAASPDLIYAAAQSDDGYHAVFKTKDGGANWIQSAPAPFGALFATVMALDKVDSNTIYLGDYDPYGEGEAIFYKSVDGGSAWTSAYQWIIGPVNALAIDPTNRTTLYAGVPEGVFRSADGGTNWSNLGLMDVTSLALDPGDANTIYTAAGGHSYFGPGVRGLFKSTDGGTSWAPINNGLATVLDSRSTVTAIVFADGNPSTLYVATSGSGIYKSLDGGGKWAPLNEGLTNLDVRLLVVSSNGLYAVTSSGIFKATD
jgi:photosystem II stability/assembly factor-like uncharacterized protein